MTLRFGINHAEALRQGIDAPRSATTIEVDPSLLSQEQRNLLADRMEGIDVHPLGAGHEKLLYDYAQNQVLLQAKAPTLEALIEAARENDLEIQPR